MSISLMTQVFNLQLQSVATKMVLLVLADNSNEQGHCWPSIQTIARKAGLRDRAVYYQLNTLEKLALIKRTERTGHSSVYQLTLPPQLTVTPAPNAPPPLHDVHPTPAPNAGAPLHQMHPEPSVEPSRNHRERAKPFSPPSIEEVRLLMAKSGLPEVEAQKFFDHHAARGWMLGRNKMKSVSHAVGTWASRYREWNGTRNYRAPSITQLDANRALEDPV